MLNPLPPFYFLAFAWLEPLGMFAGAVFAGLFPYQFYNAYLPGNEKRGGESVKLVAAGMGSCTLVIMMKRLIRTLMIR